MHYQKALSSIGTLIGSGAICILTLVTPGYGQSSVTINVDDAKDVVSPRIFGVLMERLGRQWANTGVFVGTSSDISNTNGMRDDVIEAFKECGVGSIQWPGGCAAWTYNWNPPNPSNDVGTDRFLEFCKLTGAEPIFCGPHFSNKAASNLAWLKHIDSTTARLDMDSLRWFKIGNEVWGGCGTGMDAATYCTNYLSNYNPLHDYRSSLKIEACNQVEGGGVDAWQRTLVQTLGDKFDGIEYHDYIYYPNDYPSDNFTDAQYWQVLYDASVGDFAAHMRTDVIPSLDNHDPQKRIKLIVDEWGDWLIGDNWMQTATLMDGLSAAMQLHLLMSYCDRVEIACMAQGINVIHSLLNINTNRVMVKTPTFYVFKMFKPHHENNAKLAPVTSSDIETTRQTTAGSGARNLPVMTVGSTVDDSGRVNLSVNTIELNGTREITVTLNSSAVEKYILDSAQIITASEKNATNDFGQSEQVNIKNFDASHFTLSENGKEVAVTMPSKSIVMIRLVPDPGTGTPRNGFLDKHPDDAISISTGLRGTILINGSVNKSTPLTICLYGIDGKKMVDHFSVMLEPGRSCFPWQPKNGSFGTNVYIMKAKVGKVKKTQCVLFRR